MRPKDDPTIARIREARHRISEQCGHDPQKVVEYYLRLQRNYRRRLLESPQDAEVLC